ncbi:MAG: YebC/PmpR family DNA-binding transcriptional regulator, partial [Zetaproteobacteria bacterium]|nr:YebC/PmpR family DNA-binding transcriptional regulator [Pseudobdellovibrionaceae bacterium]
HGAEDVTEQGEQYEVKCQPEDFMSVKKALDELCSEPDFCELTRVPKNTTAIEEDKIQSLEKMVQALEDKDDVQNVYHNALLSGDE